jgi:hypothetical protein
MQNFENPKTKIVSRHSSISLLLISLLIYSNEVGAQEEEDMSPEALQALDDFNYCHMPEETTDCYFDNKGSEICEESISCHNSELAESVISKVPESNFELGGPGCSVIEGSSGTDTIYIGSVFYCYRRWPVPPYACYMWASVGDFGWCKNGTLYTCMDYYNPMTVKLYAGDDIAKVPQSGEMQFCEGDDNKIGPWSYLSAKYSSIALNVYGCEGQDQIGTTPNNDIIVAGSATDTVLSYEGDDKVCGDFGGYTGDCSFCDSSSVCSDNTSLRTYDWLYGGNDTDTLCGSVGNDYIWGDNIGDTSAGAVDYIHGNEGDDTLKGGGGGDYMYGEDHCDKIYGYNGNDHIYAATSQTSLNDPCTGYNQLIGGDGDDYLFGSNAKDKMWGESATYFAPYSMDGRDELYGYAGNDYLCPQGSLVSTGEKAYGGTGDDVIYFYLSDALRDWCFNPPGHPGACAAGQVADGGEGSDTLYYAGIDCAWDPYTFDEPCPPGTGGFGCGGGIVLDGNSGGTNNDCCYCGANGYCSFNDCETEIVNGDPCVKPGTFTCYFPYVIDPDYCTDPALP